MIKFPLLYNGVKHANLGASGAWSWALDLIASVDLKVGVGGRKTSPGARQPCASPDLQVTVNYFSNCSKFFANNAKNETQSEWSYTYTHAYIQYTHFHHIKQIN